MSTVTYIMSALQVVSALIVIILVMLQKLKEGDDLTGSSNEGASGMGVSRDKKLSRLTIVFGILFAVFTVVASTLIYNDLH
jgi:protein translocase SecG subunit